MQVEKSYINAPAHLCATHAVAYTVLLTYAERTDWPKRFVELTENVYRRDAMNANTWLSLNIQPRKNCSAMGQSFSTNEHCVSWGSRKVVGTHFC